MRWEVGEVVSVDFVAEFWGEILEGEECCFGILIVGDCCWGS